MNLYKIESVRSAEIRSNEEKETQRRSGNQEDFVLSSARTEAMQKLQ
jgi:hypothetical protein